MNSRNVVDAKGLACPMPVVRTRKAIKELETGEILEIHTTDKGSVADLTAWAKSSGHEMVDQKEEDSVFTFFIKKG